MGKSNNKVRKKNILQYLGPLNHLALGKHSMATHSGGSSKITWNYALHYCEKRKTKIKTGNGRHAIGGTDFNRRDQTLDTLIGHGQ